ncbi:MAG TPA: hypothetical protein VK395_27280 [Gemmataceae bacterium]|nr:hypothetical protein [Gemmataceae bacterium]
MKHAVAIASFVVALIGFLLQEAVGRPISRLSPTNLKKLNTAKDEDDPYLYVSRNGRIHRLYYASNASGRFNILQATPDARGEWEPGQALEGLDGDAENRSPCLTLDGHDLYLATKIVVRSPDGDSPRAKNFDIVHSIGLSKVNEFTVPTPVHSVCTEADELHPWVTPDGKEMYFSRKTGDGWRIFVAPRPDGKGAFAEPKLIEELAPGFHHATLASDGRTMFLQGPLANDRWGLFRSKRTKKMGSWSRWSDPEELTNLNSPADEAPTGDMSPSLSRDDRKLYFSSDRRGGKGGRDLWMINAGGLINLVLKDKAK